MKSEKLCAVKTREHTARPHQSGNSHWKKSQSLLHLTQMHSD